MSDKSELVDEYFEINRPHGSGRLYNYLIKSKFNKAVKRLPFAIKDLELLDVCCGSGMVSEYYAGQGAEVTGLDYSEEAIARANKRKEKYDFEAQFQTGDAHNLPFRDNSFDIVSIHDGLHHLEDTAKAVKEMARVARKAVVIIEPAKSSLTEISILLGISLRYEGPDFVYRLTAEETSKWLQAAGIKKISIKRYLMYYPHEPGRVFEFLGLPGLFQLYKLCFFLINKIFGRCGNKIQIIGFK